jgi:hypothetical protein
MNTNSTHRWDGEIRSWPWRAFIQAPNAQSEDNRARMFGDFEHALAHGPLRRHPTSRFVEILRYLYSDRCVYCGQPGFVVDHVIPVSRGGPTVLWNLTWACVICNGSKGSLTANEFGFFDVHMIAWMAAHRLFLPIAS